MTYSWIFRTGEEPQDQGRRKVVQVVDDPERTGNQSLSDIPPGVRTAVSLLLVVVQLGTFPSESDTPTTLHPDLPSTPPSAPETPRVVPYVRHPRGVYEPLICRSESWLNSKTQLVGSERPDRGRRRVQF